MPADADALRRAGLRVTAPRLAVLASVREHPHADTETVLRETRDRLSGVSHQAVYDVLRALTDARLVRRFQPAGSLARYEIRVGDNHHHLVCRSCAAIVDVDCAVGTAPCLDPADDRGFVIDEAEVVYWGRCPDCASQAGAASAGDDDSSVIASRLSVSPGSAAGVLASGVSESPSHPSTTTSERKR